MLADEKILNFFRRELPVVKSLLMKSIPLDSDTILQEYAEAEDLTLAIDKYTEEFDIDVSSLNIENDIPWFFRSWFTKKPVTQSRKPLTVRMFVESAKSGR